ncbi:MAG: hypothetical protein KDK66_02035 [Deltaproteobacteria bacterium]|nr:hypothetical protein [Deltaproteobacteria bacterium]
MKHLTRLFLVLFVTTLTASSVMAAGLDPDREDKVDNPEPCNVNQSTPHKGDNTGSLIDNLVVCPPDANIPDENSDELRPQKPESDLGGQIVVPTCDDPDNDTICDVDINCEENPEAYGYIGYCGETFGNNGEGIGECVDTDEDGICDTQDTDSDNDGISDADEAGDNNPYTPAVDTDNDGIPDFRDLDSDNDGLSDSNERGDENGDGIPDRIQPDRDQDGILDGADNCVNTPNPNQEDSDFDGIGDVCDSVVTGSEGGADAPTSFADGVFAPTSVQGAGCSLMAGASSSWAFLSLLLAPLGLSLAARRRRS